MPAFAAFKSMHDVSRVGIGSEAKLKDDQRYNALRNLDDHSDSSTEVEDWEEDDDLKVRRQRAWRSLKRYRWVIDTTLLLVILGLLVDKTLQHDHSHQFEFAGDITGFAPTCKSTQ
jgi:hypothetical protein